MKKTILFALTALLSLSVLLAGCQKTEDKRQYISVIGVIFTNEAENIIDELYVYPSTDEYNSDKHAEEMGEDHIKNSNKQKRIGSFGITLEESESYDVMLNDFQGGAYHFDNITLFNADHAVIGYDSSAGGSGMILTINGAEVITGEYLTPGDAPDHTHNPMRKEVSYKFVVNNETGGDISLITMREEQDHPDVELYIKTLADGKSTTVGGKLYEEDQEVTVWHIYVETADGKSGVATTTFDPWSAESVTITSGGGGFDISVTN